MDSRLWKFISSLRLTVICLSFGILLVFLGTVAQVEEGLYAAQARWFRSFIVWFNFFGWQPGGLKLNVPLPGGYLVGFVLLANLITNHAKRFTWAVPKIGVQLTHAGVILLIMGQLATDMLSEESHLGLREGQAKSFTEDHRDNELVLLTDAGNGQEEVTSVPDTLIAKGGDLGVPKLPVLLRVKEYQVNSELFSRTSLVEPVNTVTRALATMEGQFSTPEALVPLAEKAKESSMRVFVWQQAFEAIGEKDNNDIVAAARRVQPQTARAEKLCMELKTRFRGQMLEAFINKPRATRAEVFVAKRYQKNQPIDLEKVPQAATQGDGPAVVVFPMPEAKDGNSRNLPYAIVEALEGGKSLGTWVFHPFLEPQPLTTANGKPVRAALRFLRYYHPFSVKLVKTTHEVYPGTITSTNEEGIPKNFQSRVEIDNPGKGEKREVDIYMNNPLRYGGLTFFQYQMGRDEMAGREVSTSTLQVVRNPSWITPYIGCIVVGGGMLYQFLYHLVGFIGKRRRGPDSPAAESKRSKKSAVPVS